MRRTKALWILLFLGGLVSCRQAPPVGPGEWPQWRGPASMGISTAVGLPEVWGPGSDNLRWQTVIPGEGNSSPIVSHGKVFLTTGVRREATEADDDRTVERLVLAVDLAGGEILWQTQIGPGRAVRKHAYNTWASPTPATDGETVFAHFGDTLAAVDHQGRLLWSREIDPNYGELSVYGASSSVVLTDASVVVFQDREDLVGNGWLAAFDKKTGDELWRRSWDDSCCSYTTPLALERGAGTELLVTHAGGIVAYEPATGEILWRHQLPLYQPVASSVLEGDLLAVFTGAHGNRYGAVLRLSGAGRETGVELLWETPRLIPETASPVLYDGKLVSIMEQGVIICREIATGKQLWRVRLAPDLYEASLVAGDGKFYAVGMGGVTSVMAADREYRLIAENLLEEGGNASPAIADGSLLLRTKTKLTRIDPAADRAPQL